MLSNSCRYGIRAVIYLASRADGKSIIDIKKISKDLGLPAPFLAKILQQLTRQKLLSSTKGPHGGFSLLKAPSEITLFDIVKTIDGEEVFTNCIIHNSSCKSVNMEKKSCPLHDDYSSIRKVLIDLFRSKSIAEIVKKLTDPERVTI